MTLAASACGDKPTMTQQEAACSASNQYHDCKEDLTTDTADNLQQQESSHLLQRHLDQVLSQ